MKRTYLTVTGLALAATLAACGGSQEQAAEAPAAAPTETATAAPAGDAASSNMAGMNMGSPQAAKTAKGTGTVTAVDATAGTVTINHGPIPEAGWPAMTMGFKAAPEVAQGVKPGDKVAFDLTLEAGGGQITAIQKQ